MEVKDSTNPYQGRWVHPFNTWIYRSFHKPEQNNSVNTCAVTNFETNFMPSKKFQKWRHIKVNILVFGVLFIYVDELGDFFYLVTISSYLCNEPNSKGPAFRYHLYCVRGCICTEMGKNHESCVLFLVNYNVTLTQNCCLPNILIVSDFHNFK